MKKRNLLGMKMMMRKIKIRYTVYSHNTVEITLLDQMMIDS